ncbi:hypothetical protein CRYUN_Cryun22dG0068600 [Craigia yunnanensis]
MTTTLIGGAALGAGFELLVKAVVDATKTAAMFRDVLKDLESTLSSIEPKIKDIESFNKIDLQIQQTRDIKDVLFEVKGLGLEFRRFSSKEGSGSGNGMFSQVAVVGSCKVPEPLGKIVGFDVRLKELKMKLFKDGVSVIVVCWGRIRKDNFG